MACGSEALLRIAAHREKRKPPGELVPEVFELKGSFVIAVS
jgi:hypothetical protein